MDITAKLELWEELADLKPSGSKKMRIPENGKLTYEEINALNEDLFKINKNYDVDDIYSTIYLKHYFDLLIKQQILTTATYLNHREEFQKYFQQCDLLKDALLDNDEKHVRSETIRLLQEFNISNHVDLQNINIRCRRFKIKVKQIRFCYGKNK